MKFKKTALHLAITMGLGMAITACGGGGGGGDSSSSVAEEPNNPQQTEQTITTNLNVVVQDFDGTEITSGNVCLDANEDDYCDADETVGSIVNGTAKLAFKRTVNNSSSTKTNSSVDEALSGNLLYKKGATKIKQKINHTSQADATYYLNAATTLATIYAKDKGISYNNSKRIVSNQLGAKEADFNGKMEVGTALNTFFYSLANNKVELNSDIVDLHLNAVGKIQEFLNKNPNIGQTAISDNFKKNANFDNLDQLEEEISRNTAPTVDGIQSDTTAECLVGKFTAVNANDIDGDTLEFCWNFGDGTKDSCVKNTNSITHKFNDTNVKNISLVVKDGLATSSKIETNYIPDNSVCVGDVTSKITYTITSQNDRIFAFNANAEGDVASVEWNFGDDSTSKEVSPSHQFPKADVDKNYTVSLVVYDSYGKSHPAESIEVTVSTDKNEAPVITKNDTFATIKENSLSFSGAATDVDTDSSKLTFTWDFGDGSTSNKAQGSYVYQKSGTFDVTLTVSDGVNTVSEKIATVSPCGDSCGAQEEPKYTTTLSELSNSNLIVSLSANTTNDKNTSASYVYTWNFGDNTSNQTGASVNHTYAKAGTYTVSVSASVNGKVVSTESKTVKVTATQAANHAPFANGTAQITGATLKFTSTSRDEDGDKLTYAWNFGDNSGTSTLESGTYTYKKDGTYTVTLTVSDGKEKSVKEIGKFTAKVSSSGGDNTTNHAPKADFHYSFNGLVGTLTAVASDEDKDQLTYAWSAEGATIEKDSGKSTKITFSEGGKKVVKLIVSDGKLSAEKTYNITLANVQKPTEKGIYYKGDYTNIYIWDDDQNKLAGAWPGSTMTDTGINGWKFFDTSSIDAQKVNIIFNGNGQQTGDLTNSPITGCYENSWVELDACSLSSSGEGAVEGGAEIVVNPGEVLNNGITWNALDFGSYTSTSDVYVEAAPYVTTTLAPGSYSDTQKVSLKIEDAERNPTSGTIYYTLDNSVPSESSKVYDGEITLEDTSTDGLGTAYRLRTLVVGENGLKQEQHFFWFIKNDAANNVAPATDFRDETIYFVVTARYYDGDESNNYFDRDRFDATDPSWRGDFKGLIEKLDYIKDLGFTAIWITPPVENRSGLDYHGYHAYDWFQPDLRLESPGATYFDFIKAAHKKGIKVIQDVVLNHSSNYGIRGQAYIEKIPNKYWVDAGDGKDGTNYGPYKLHTGDYLSYGRCDNDNPVAPTWHRRVCAGDPDAKATFSVNFKNGTSIVNGANQKGQEQYYWSPAVASYLPEKWYHVGYTNNWESVSEVQQRSMAGDCVDLKTESQNVQDYMNYAIKMYIDMGIDAIRIDTLKHMPRADVMSMVHTWQQYKPNMFVYGEALIKGFGDNTPSELLPWYYTRTGSADSKTGDSKISVLDFSLMSTFRDNVTKGSVGGLADVFNRFDGDYADATKLVTFFQNHDLTPDNTWSGSGAQHCCEDRNNSALAYNVLWTVRGIPVMYAGDETGSRIGLPPDLTSSNDLVANTGRLYIGDDLVAGKDPIQAHIKDLNAIRKTSKALQRGTLKVLQGEPLVFERQYESERAIVAIPGTSGGSVTVSGATDGTYVDVVTGKSYTVSGGSVDLGNIPGASMRVLVKDYQGGKVASSSSFLK